MPFIKVSMNETLCRKGEPQMKLYDKFTTYFLLGFLLAFNVGLVIVCGVIYYHYLIESYRPEDGFVGIALMLGSLLAVDIAGHKCQAFIRFLVRCKFNEKGIYCHGFCVKSWFIPWDKICTYGITGFKMDYGIIFFSLDPNEIFINRKETLKLNHQRIVFQVRDEIWPELSKFMPEDMKKQLRYSIDCQKDCFCKRKIVK